MNMDDLHVRTWWPTADLGAQSGGEVIVHDPDVSEIERFWPSTSPPGRPAPAADYRRGTITVIPTPWAPIAMVFIWWIQPSEDSDEDRTPSTYPPVSEEP